MAHGLELAPDNIRQELERILSSADFMSTRQLSNLLRFVVEEALAGRSDQLKAYTIATSVLGRGNDYDPQADATVRILAGRLRARLAQYYSGPGKGNQLHITVPKGSYVPAFQQPKAGMEERADKVDRVEGAAVSGKPSIAVLPFTNFDTDADESYLARGLTERLILTLGSYDGLTVLPRWASIELGGQSGDAYRTGHLANIKFVMEGSVRRHGSALRVSVYLSDVASNRQIWTEAYERAFTPENLLTIEDEIAHQVSIKIGDIYGGVISRIARKEQRESQPSTVLTAYDALVHYMHFFTELNPKNYTKTRQLLEKAYKDEPNSAELCAVLSIVYRAGYGFGFSKEDDPLDRVLELALKAVSLDPRSRDARIALAGAYQLMRDRMGMIRESEILLSLTAAGTRSAVAGWNIALAGEWERGLAILRPEIRLLRYYPGWLHIAPCLDYYRRNEYRKACQETYKMRAPTVYWEPLLRAAALGQLGEASEARPDLLELMEFCPDFHANPRRYLNWAIPDDELVNHVLEGLGKAGLSTV